MAGEWKKERLSALCSEIADCPHSTPLWTDSGALVLRSQNIRNGRLDLSAKSYTDEAHFEQRSRRARLRGGDLVITREAPMGEVCLIPNGLRCCLGQRMVMLRPDPKKCDSRFLLYSIQSRAVQDEIKVNEGTGSTVSNLRIPLLEALPIPHPPLAEQKAIAAVLGALDDKIELNRRMNATLEAMARALFQSWFVDFDPVRAKLHGRPPVALDPATAALFPDSFQDSSLGHIPKGWEAAELGQIAHVIDCLHAKKPERCDAGQLYLQLNNIRDDGLIDITDSFFVGAEDYQKWISRMEAVAGDCVITNVGRVGAVGQIPEGVKAALGRNITGIRCKAEFPFPTFLIECLVSESMRGEIRLKTDSGTILDALNVKSIPKLRFVRPTREIGARFEELTRPVRRGMEQNISESRTLATLRDTLLPKLLSGEISPNPTN